MSDTKEVFKLRKEKKISEAYTLAFRLYSENPNDEWIQKAYAWVLIDIIKIEINNNLDKAQMFFYQLQSINFNKTDEIINKQINFLKPKLNSNYQEIQKAENLSKNGNYQASINIFKQLYQNGKLSNEYHQSYGWAIYRLLSNNKENLNINEVKYYLMQYLKLQNPKPEMLHSFILQFAIIYASEHDNFDIYKFFQIWGPQYLRDEDKKQQYKDDKIYPSLIERFIRLLVDKNYNFDVKYLQNNIKDDLLVVEIIRERYFWKIFNLHKNNKLQELWEVFDFYVNKFSNYGKSYWHSEILKLATRFMVEKNLNKFFNFFKFWDYHNLRYEDWQDEVNEEYTNKSLAKKSLSLINKYIKSNVIEINDLDWVLEFYDIALKYYKYDIWLLRKYAILLSQINKVNDAIGIYKNIILDLTDQAYIWHEFAKLLENIDINIAISMLCKALIIQKNEDFLDNIHLDLAKLLIKQELFVEAKTELSLYEKHRKEKGWTLSEDFIQLNNQFLEIIPNETNKVFYNDNVKFAEDYIYNDIEWTNLLLFDKFKTLENKEKIKFSNLQDIELVIDVSKFSLLKDSKKDEVYQAKLHYNKLNNKYIVLKIQKSSITKEDLVINNSLKGIVVVDHVNKDKELFHYVLDRETDGIVKFNQTTLRPNIGDFLELNYFKTFNHKKNNYKVNILDIKTTNKKNNDLIKEISDFVSINYKNGKIAFGFVYDYYIPGFLLEKLGIEDGDYISVKMIFNPKETIKRQWKVFEVKLIEKSEQDIEDEMLDEIDIWE